MSASEVYKNFLLKVNKNDSEANIRVRKSHFVRIFNEQRNRWYEHKLNKRNDVDTIEDLRHLKKTHLPLQIKSSFDNRTEFVLPDDVFRYIHSYTIAKKGECTLPLFNDRPNHKNIGILLSDEFHQPSFEYQETTIELGNKIMIVYKSDFDIEGCYLTYWSEIEPIDVAGYIKADRTESKDRLDSRLLERDIDEIVNRCAEEVIRIYENPDGYEMAVQRNQMEDRINSL